MAGAGSDWRIRKSVIECNRYMLDNQVHNDVTFNVKGTMILAHRVMLISRSQVFESKLVGQPSSNIIQIPDVSPAIFRKMLSYIYCDSVEMDDNDSADLLNAAKKFKISGLEDLCLQRMKTGVSIESVCVVLNHAVDTQLKEKCLEFIFKYAQQVIITNGFLELSPLNLKTIVQDDRFNVKEESIFEALVKWSEKECQRQNVPVNLTNQNDYLLDVIKCIRFGLMEHRYLKDKCKSFLTSDVYVCIMEELANVGDNSGIFRRKRGLVSTPDDSNAVSSTLTPTTTVSTRVFDQPSTSGYSSPTSPVSINSTFGPMAVPPNTRVLHPRENPMEVQASPSDSTPENTNCIRPVTAVGRYSFEHKERIKLGYLADRDRRIVVDRFGATRSGKAYTRDNKDGISFIASHRLKLHGILIYGSHQRPGSYQVELEIYKDNTGSGLTHVFGLKTTMQTDGSTKVYELVINPPAEVERDKVYTIRSLFKGQASYYGVEGQHIVLKDGISINFVTDITCLNLTSMEIGQFPGLIFEKV